jgi:hypothetical protein
MSTETDTNHVSVAAVADMKGPEEEPVVTTHQIELLIGANPYVCNFRNMLAPI